MALLLRLLVAWEDRERRDAGRGRADRYLVAAAIVFGLSVGNHSLTLLLALPVAALRSDRVPAGLAAIGGLSLLCIGAFIATVVLVYLELPLRAGPFRAPLVYGRPETWDGFWYVVLGEQFRANVVDPFGDLAGKVGSLVDRAATQFGPLATLLPVAFAATVAPAAALRGADRVCRRHHLLLRGLVPECRHRAVLPGPGPDGLDVARDPRRGGRSIR